jgi:hypothetical protein
LTAKTKLGIDRRLCCEKWTHIFICSSVGNPIWGWWLNLYNVFVIMGEGLKFLCDLSTQSMKN